MAKEVRILCMHGLGGHEANWMDSWQAAIESLVPQDANVQLVFDNIYYDEVFEENLPNAAEMAETALELLWSGLRRRWFWNMVPEKIKYSAGYIGAWLNGKGFREEIRNLVRDKVAAFQPDIFIAHSLGSLISYDTFSHPESEPIFPELKHLHYITIGSQLNNRFVKYNLTPGRLTGLPVKSWRHFYNPHDKILTEAISLPDVENFHQIITDFQYPEDTDDRNNHSAPHYLKHPNAADAFWKPLFRGRLSEPLHATRSIAARQKTRHTPKRRALLIGINEYPSEGAKLDGCVNDVFMMSSVLQECGFAADDIRVCLDERATRDGILERLEWLLEDPLPGDQRIFYFSGHGAQMAEYGPGGEPDHMLECLVPYDFDWTIETGITDREIEGLYSQLPYDFSLAMIFDCCHSGGIHRDASAKKRGLTPPDDIRHRAMKWDLESEMWVERDFEPLNKRFARSEAVQREFFGKNHATARLGRASLLRGMAHGEYDRMRERKGGPIGPYLPMIIESCREEEYAYEYRHGVTSYGAFTYSLASILRREGRTRNVTFRELVTKAGDQIERLGYDQKPSILGPSSVLDAPIPWMK